MTHKHAFGLLLAGLIPALQFAELSAQTSRPTNRPTVRPARSKPAKSEPTILRSRPSKALTKPRRAWGLVWQPTLKRALTAASKSRREKPVLWLQVLGKLDGLT